MSDTTQLCEELRKRARHAKKRVLVLDYDGTLIPFASQPESARPDHELLRLLEKLTASNDVWVVSGRSRASLGEMLGALPIGLGAEHGAWFRPHGATDWRLLIPETHSAELALPSLQHLVERWPGSRIERKEMSFAWHYRLATPRPDDGELGRIESELAALAERCHCSLLTAVLAFEIRPRHAHKGLVVREIARSLNGALLAPSAGELLRIASGAADEDDGAGAFMLIAGDDVTDGDMFTHAPPIAVKVAVGERLHGATHRVATPRSLRAILARLVE